MATISPAKVVVKASAIPGAITAISSTNSGTSYAGFFESDDATNQRATLMAVANQTSCPAAAMP